MKFGNCNLGGLKKLQEKLNKVQQSDMDAFLTACAKELAARLLREVIRSTPVGDYSTEVEVTAKKDSKYHKKGETYYKAGNSRVAYNHTAVTTAVWWWLRSPYYNHGNGFRSVSTDGSHTSYGASGSAGVRPGFSV